MEVTIQEKEKFGLQLILVFTVVLFYKVTANAEIANSESDTD